MAGNIAFDHCDDGKPETMPPLLVTAAVERIQMLRPITIDQDVTLGGQVVYTGRSSLDIRLTLQHVGAAAPSLVALFTFVARDPRTKKAAAVNHLNPEGSKETRWFKERADVAEARKAARRAGGAADSPSSDAFAERRRAWTMRMLSEARARHVMPGLSAGDALLIDESRLSNTFTCQPQQRNMHGRIFGGFLMRRAYELAFATVHMFAGRRPRFVEVDRVDFTRPVDVGDLVTFQSAVLHSKNLMDHPNGPRGVVFVEVEASVNRPESVSSATTNRFLLTFEIDLETSGDGGSSSSSSLIRPLKRVLPASEQQALSVERFYPTQYENQEA